ncbi:MAG: TRAP transporter small permease, partial [Planktotalea arctica]
MNVIGRLYLWVLYAMAGIAGAMLIWLMISVVTSVMMRNLGLQPFAWLFTSSEYAILYMTMLG